MVHEIATGGTRDAARSPPRLTWGARRRPHDPIVQTQCGALGSVRQDAPMMHEPKPGDRATAGGDPDSIRARELTSKDSASVAAGPFVGRRAQLRDDLERRILAAAEETFAMNGFGGSSVAVIAAAAGISKQNLLYYYPNKIDLYRTVLDDVLEDWLGCMIDFAATSSRPEEAISRYIEAKLEFSRRRPQGSRVFALEIIGGARNYGNELKSKIVPALRADIATLERLLGSRDDDRINAEHLFFIIWASTQSYADFSAQMELILDRKPLAAQDFEAARSTLTRLVLNSLGLPSPMTGARVETRSAPEGD
ncbi:TetR family transcriptional regulator C-terminal domain-containing protein [Methylobacterium sp. NEAU 140]|uniref:TetR family transcriptional regulator C-terminal domain-containing protein n=1 Tax=Methylobacterium sp. NEAU 140 TaxID=3064945 RepID=UPI002732AB22|nr:TetR family transcriptional regulator C-terminal domain-containing protein [Methylobacterium sp. NEAU 140]MDP4021921.1 TetR family transcriptional regulator C-terminal domain-containing protein [Methylobacterium sp. NEAU 140]